MGLVFRGAVWFGLYFMLLLLPLGVALLADPIAAARPFTVELSVALGFIAFALMSVEFALVSRLKAASEPFGEDALMLFHRQMGLAATAFVALHVIALLAPGTREDLAMSVAARGVGWTGAAAVLALAVLIGSSVWRKHLGLRYERWQRLHGVLAVTITAASLAHVLAVDHYLSARSVRIALVLYVVLFAALLVRYRLLRPLGLRRRPCEVIANRDEGGETRTLVLRPVGWDGFGFAPGQFGWLVTGRGPFTGEQHPISFSSSAERGPSDPFEMSIKALGDWSGAAVPRIAVGRKVWVDGPYGAFTPDRTPGQGFVLIAGGVGITPMRSILHTMRDRQDVRPVLLIHAANRPERMLFRDEIEALRGAVNLRCVPVFEAPPPEWNGESGFVTRELLVRHLPAQYLRHQFFVCGPPPMMDLVEGALLALGVPPDRIGTERFDLI